MQKNEKILIIENDAQNMQFFTTSLQGVYELITTNSYKIANEYLQAQVNIRLIIVDYILAKLKKYRPLKEIITYRTDIPIVIIAHLSQQQEINTELKKHQHIHFLFKPLHYNHLIFLCKKLILWRGLRQEQKHQNHTLIDEQEHPPQQKNFNIQLSNRLFISANLQEVPAKIVSYDHKGIEIINKYHFKKKTELMLIIKHEGYLFRVNQSVAGKDGSHNTHLLIENTELNLRHLLESTQWDFDKKTSFSELIKVNKNKSNFELNFPKNILYISETRTPDQEILHCLENTGTDKISIFQQGEKAWTSCLHTIYDFIILDWQVKDIKSTALINRFRTHSLYKYIPLLVIVTRLDKDDFSILDESPLTSYAEKPLSRSFVEKKIIQLHLKKTWLRAQEAKIFRQYDIWKKNKTFTDETVMRFVAESAHPFDFSMIMGEILQYYKKQSTAELIYKYALKSPQKNVAAAHQLGEIYWQTGQSVLAKKAFRKSYLQSPHNIERLCYLAQLQLRAIDTTTALKFLHQALSIDKSFSHALRGCQLASHINEYFLLENSAFPDSYEALIKAIGVHLIEKKRYYESIDLFLFSLEYFDDIASRSMLAFHLGFSYLQNHNTEKAVFWFFHSLELDPENDQVVNYLSIAHQQRKEKKPAPKRGQASEDMEALKKNKNLTQQTVYEDGSPEYQQLIAAIPIMEEFIQRLRQEHTYIPGQRALLYRLWKIYGTSILADNLDYAIKNGITGLFDLVAMMNESQS